MDEPRNNDDEEITIHHSVHHPRRVDVRIDGAHGNPLDPPLTQIETTARRLLWYLIMGTLTFVVAFGTAFYVQAKGTYRDCADRNYRQAATARALSDLAAAAEASGDPKEAKVLREFQDSSFRTPDPECSRPPFTREYTPRTR